MLSKSPDDELSVAENKQKKNNMVQYGGLDINDIFMFATNTKMQTCKHCVHARFFTLRITEICNRVSRYLLQGVWSSFCEWSQKSHLIIQDTQMHLNSKHKSHINSKNINLYKF